MMQSPPNDNHCIYPGAIPLASRYTAGAAGQLFFDSLKRRGVLLAARCGSCKLVYFPPRAYCERCFGALGRKVAVQPRGRIVSYTVCYVDRDRAPLRRPRALALVRLDGADTVLLHHLLGVRSPDELAVGSSVTVKIKPKRQRTGSILDIEGFALAKKAPAADQSASPARRRRSRRSGRKGAKSR